MKVGAGLPGATPNPSETNPYPKVGRPPAIRQPHYPVGATIVSPNLKFDALGPEKSGKLREFIARKKEQA